MTIERINPDDVYPPFNDAYTQVVIGTGTRQIHIAGTLAADKDRNLIGVGDQQAQARAIMDVIGASLAAAGATAADVVRINIFTVDMAGYLQGANREVAAFFGDTKPASTLVEVSKLAGPDLLLEIQATAVVD